MSNNWLLESFKYGASKIDISDGCIKCIYLENSKETQINEENEIQLTDGCNALIEFENGKKMVITNSEWCYLIFFDKNKTELSNEKES